MKMVPNGTRMRHRSAQWDFCVEKTEGGIKIIYDDGRPYGGNECIPYTDEDIAKYVADGRWRITFSPPPPPPKRRRDTLIKWHNDLYRVQISSESETHWRGRYRFFNPTTKKWKWIGNGLFPKDEAVILGKM